MAEQPRCHDVRDLIPELALGVASGDDRAAALAHLAGCAECRALLADAAAVTDELLLLAPEHEPPAGFDVQVLEAIAPRRRWTTPVLAAAAVLVAALAATLVTRWADADDRELADQYRQTLDVADGSYLRAAELSAGAGHVFAYEGKPSWVFVTVQDAPSGRYAVTLVTKDGRSRSIGYCSVENGRGSWGVAIDLPVYNVDRIALTRPGTTLSASFARS